MMILPSVFRLGPSPLSFFVEANAILAYLFQRTLGDRSDVRVRNFGVESNLRETVFEELEGVREAVSEDWSR